MRGKSLANLGTIVRDSWAFTGSTRPYDATVMEGKHDTWAVITVAVG